MTETAVRSVRTALIAALKASVPLVGGRVYTPPVHQKASTFPRLQIDGYAEDPSNFYGRPGSWVRCLVKGQAKSLAGDAPREALWEETYAALHNQPIEIDGHLLLIGTLRRTATYLDPDGETLHFVGTYEATTRIA